MQELSCVIYYNQFLAYVLPRDLLVVNKYGFKSLQNWEWLGFKSHCKQNILIFEGKII